MCVLVAPGSAASAMTDQHLDGLSAVVAGAGPETVQGSAPNTHIPTLALSSGSASGNGEAHDR
eukprot:11212325-Lingulodinium_polyedra.AAC.1